MVKLGWIPAAVALAAAATACNDDGSTGGGGSTSASTSSASSTSTTATTSTATTSSASSGTGGAGPIDVQITFEAKVGDAAFDCKTTYDHLGTADSSIDVSDFRLYVHDVALMNAAHTMVPLTLTQDGTVAARRARAPRLRGQDGCMRERHR